MGLTSSSTAASSTTGSSNKPSTVLPHVGCGSFDVGCADIMIAAEAVDHGDTGLYMRLFYPTHLKTDDPQVNSDSGSSAEYPLWNERREYLDGLADYRQMSHRKIHFYFDWIIGERRVPAGWHLPLVPREKTDDNALPVVIFSHGLSGSRLIYSTLCSSIASYGFVVAAVEHRDRSSSWTRIVETDPVSGITKELPITMLMLGDDEREFKKRNQQNHKRVTECVRALHVLEELNLGQCAPADKKPKGSKIVVGQDFDWLQFKNRLDIGSAAVVGHSMGGATAVAAAAFSTDFQASVVLDGWFYPIEHELYSRTAQPMLLINVDSWQWAENLKRMLMLDNTAANKIMYTLKDVVHQSFSDFTYLMPGYLGKKFSVQGEVHPYEAGEAILEMMVTFMRRVFAQKSSTEALREVTSRYADFVVEGTTINLDEKDVENDMLEAEEQLIPQPGDKVDHLLDNKIDGEHIATL